MRALLLTLAVSTSLLLPTRGEAATLRCGNQLASDGASKSDVLMRCGEPMAKESHTETVGEKTSTPNEQGGSNTQQHTVRKTIEEWTYNFGPSRLMQVAVFENGRLIDVRSGGYGR